MKKNHIWVFILLASVLLFTNLGDRHLWGDELHLVSYAKTISQYGLPILDAQIEKSDPTYETPASQGTDKVHLYINWNGNKIYTYHPWLPSYIAVIPYTFFGFNAFWMRFPFALISLLSLIPVYYLARKIFNDRTAIISLLVYTTSIVFLLASRNANYYSLLFFLVSLIALLYLRVLENKNESLFAFICSLALLFYAQWLAFFAVILGLLMHFLVFRKFNELKRFVLPIFVLFLLTFPWFYLTGQLQNSANVVNVGEIFFFAVLTIFNLSNWFMPMLFVLFLAIYSFKKKSELYQNERYYLIVFLIIGHILLISLNGSFTGAPIRYFYGIFPLCAILSGYCISKIYLRSKHITVVILLLLIFTNILNVIPAYFFKDLLLDYSASKDVLSTPDKFKQEFILKSLKIRMPFFEYVGELINHVASPTEEVLKLIGSGRNKTVFIQADIDARMIGYLTDSKIYTYDWNYDKEFDWIIIDKYNDKNKNIDLKKYAKITVNSKPDKWMDTADPIHHKFKTDNSDYFYVYKRLN